MKPICTLLILIHLSLTGFGQSGADTLENDIVLYTHIEQDQVPLNRNVIYHVQLQWEGPLTRFRINDIGEPVTTNLIANGNGSSNKIGSDSQGRTISTKTITYYFKPVEIDMAYIDGVTIKYEDMLNEHQESLLSGRIGVKIIEPVPEPGAGISLSNIIYFILIAAVIATGLYFVLQYRRRKQEAYTKSLLNKKETLESKYIRLLKDTIHLNVDGIKESVGELSRLLSGYFLERYQMNITGMNSNLLLEHLNEKINDPETVERIIDFYNRTEKVKFAGEGIDESEFHRLYDTVELVLEYQKSQYAEKEEV